MENVSLTPNRIVLRCPEITLKGKNQDDFMLALVENVAHRLRAIGARWQVHYAHGRVYVDVPGAQAEMVEEAVQALSEVAGVDSLAATVWHRPSVTGQHTDSPDKALIAHTAVGLARAHYAAGATFAVRVNRVDKRLPLTSIEMERWLGEVIRNETAWDRVNLKRPHRTFAIDVYPDGMYFRVDKHKGVGGLPVGTGGRLLVLLSGGIDSPVATFLMAKRGCNLDLFHLTATYSQLREDSSPVVRLARQLSRYTLRSRLFMAPATHLELVLSGPTTGYEAILFRRFLVRTGAVLAARLQARALVTGDSLGQVASQTLENLATVYRVTEIPVFHPLIGFNKQETIDLARRIGTYETSIERYKDCCALLAQSPRTRSESDQLDDLEKRLLPDYDSLIERTLEDLVWRRFDCGEATGEWQTTEQETEQPSQPTTAPARSSPRR